MVGHKADPEPPRSQEDPGANFPRGCRNSSAAPANSNPPESLKSWKCLGRCATSMHSPCIRRHWAAQDKKPQAAGQRRRLLPPAFRRGCAAWDGGFVVQPRSEVSPSAVKRRREGCRRAATAQDGHRRSNPCAPRPPLMKQQLGGKRPWWGLLRMGGAGEAGSDSWAGPAWGSCHWLLLYTSLGRRCLLCLCREITGGCFR